MATSTPPPIPETHEWSLRPALRAGPLVTAGIFVIAFHVADDSFLQPQPGTSAGDHIVSGMVPLGLLALVAFRSPPVRGGARAAMALTIGVFGIIARRKLPTTRSTLDRRG